MNDKQKNDFTIIEDEPPKPKRKPKLYYGRPLRPFLFIVGLLVLVLGMGIGIGLLVTPQRIAIVLDHTPTLSAYSNLTTSPNLPSTPTLLPEMAKASSGLPVTELAWAPDGKTLAVADTQFLRLYDLDLSTPPVVVEQHEGGLPGNMAFSPDGRTLAIPAHTNTEGITYIWTDKSQWGDVTLWDIAGQKPRAILKGHKNLVASLAFNQDGTRLITGGADAMVIIWDTATALPIMQLSGNLVPLDDVVFSPRQTVLAVGMATLPGGGQLVDRWNLQSGNTEPVTLLQYDNVPAPILRFNRIGTQLAVPLAEEIWIVDLATQSIVTKVPTPREPATNKGTTLVEFSPDSHFLVATFVEQTRGASGPRATLQLWNLSTRQIQLVLENATSQFTTVAFNADGTKLAIATKDGRVQIREVPSGRLLQDLQV